MLFIGTVLRHGSWSLQGYQKPLSRRQRTLGHKDHQQLIPLLISDRELEALFLQETSSARFPPARDKPLDGTSTPETIIEGCCKLWLVVTCMLHLCVQIASHQGADDEGYSEEPSAILINLCLSGTLESGVGKHSFR